MVYLIYPQAVPFILWLPMVQPYLELPKEGGIKILTVKKIVNFTNMNIISQHLPCVYVRDGFSIACVQCGCREALGVELKSGLDDPSQPAYEYYITTSSLCIC